MTPRSAENAALSEVLGLSWEEFEEQGKAVVDAAGEPAYRLRQIRDWMYSRTPGGFHEMSNVPQRLRQRLADSWVLHPLEKVTEQISGDGTRKFLWSRRPAGTVESVIIPDGDRATYCISTQGGCPVKCSFCATGMGGFRGNLRAAEIVDQVLFMRHLTGEGPTNIVYMGMGEPLINFPAVARSLEILSHPDQVGFGARRITVSTVGIPGRILELGKLFPQVKLALSLHAARDELRSRIIPINRKYPLRQVIAAVKDHTRITGKKATFEYIVLPGVNDTDRDAREIGKLLAGIPSRINLIGFNPFPGAPYEKPSIRRLLRFREWVEAGFPGAVTIRRSRGEDIQGACGQLTARYGRQDPRKAQ